MFLEACHSGMGALVSTRAINIPKQQGIYSP
jgi:hypothetical protein